MIVACSVRYSHYSFIFYINEQKQVLRDHITVASRYDGFVNVSHFADVAIKCYY